MDPATFELSFELPAIGEDVEDRVVDTTGAVISYHSGVTVATLLTDADTCLQAALLAAQTLRDAGAPPLRLIENLVSRAEIATRAGVTPQAVGQWVRGERRSNAPFPKPYVVGAQELYLWGEVVGYLRAIGLPADDGVSFPQRRDIQLVGGALAAAAAAIASGWSASSTVNPAPAAATVRSSGQPQVPVAANRTAFALAS